MNRLAVTVAFIAAFVPAVAWSQAPVLLSSWTMNGSMRVWNPMDLAIDAGGHVYVTDPAQRRVFVFTADGDSVTSWHCPAIPMLDFHPYGIAVSPGGVVYVTTPFPNGTPPFEVTAYTTSGAYLGPVGRMGYDPGELGVIMDVAVDGSGNVYLVDWPNFRVEVLASDGHFVTEWGSCGSAPGQFRGPVAIAVSRDSLVYTTDIEAARVQVFTKAGDFVTQWGLSGQYDVGPWGLAVDASGNVFVTDEYNCRLQVFTGSGQLVTQWGTRGEGPGQFTRPHGVAVAPDGRIYVADTFNHRIDVFAPLPQDVRVDLRPGDSSDVVNPGARGVLPVAILSEPQFDATTVDPLSVRLAGAEVRTRPNGEPMVWSRDVDGDGRLDLLLHIDAAALVLAPGDTIAQLAGQAAHQQIVRGSARVRVVGNPAVAAKRQTQSPLSAVAPVACLVRARFDPHGGVVAFVQLAADGPARLDLVDVGGRHLGSSLLDGPLTGSEFSLGPRNLSPGIYWVRLQQAGHVSAARVAAVR